MKSSHVYAIGLGIAVSTLGMFGCSSNTSGSKDMASIDMAMPPQPDMALIPDMATCVWSTGNPAFVDPVNGTDDTSHGNQAGACAYKSLPFALAHASNAMINLALATYTTPTGMNNFFTLSGTQGIDCDPSNTGHPATLTGGNSDGSNSYTVVVAGSGNVIKNCIVTTTNPNASNPNGCIHITGTGPAMNQILNTTVTNCGGMTLGAGTAITLSAGVSPTKIANCTFTHVGNGVEIFDSAAPAHVLQNNTFDTIVNNGIACFGGSDTAVTGCGSMYSSTTTQCSTCGNCPFTTTPCP
jgi:hypothetical protein